MASWDCFSVLGDELVKVSQRVGESWEWKILSSVHSFNLFFLFLF